MSDRNLADEGSERHLIVNAGTESECEGGIVIHHLPRSEDRARNRDSINQLMQDLEVSPSDRVVL
jgi:hypothetical protein